MSSIAIRIFGLLSLLVSIEARAGLVTYATRAEWTASIGSFQTEDFETTPPQQTRCPEYTIADGCPHSVTIQTDKLEIVMPVRAHSQGYDGIFANGAVNGTNEFRTDLHYGILVTGMDFNTIVFKQPIFALAIDLANVTDFDYGCDRIPCGSPIPFPMSISISGQAIPLPFGARFFGAISDTPFTDVILRASSNPAGWVVLASLDDISFSVVPEPGPALGLGLGLGILAWLARSAGRSKVA